MVKKTDGLVEDADRRPCPVSDDMRLRDGLGVLSASPDSSVLSLLRHIYLRSIEGEL
jgi:hypothetical protein